MVRGEVGVSLPPAEPPSRRGNMLKPRTQTWMGREMSRASAGGAGGQTVESNMWDFPTKSQGLKVTRWRCLDGFNYEYIGSKPLDEYV